ncbi:hypothetical protein Pyrfu_0319 [Pyrolobus fumarii 1A]|uniref:Uncharacterized protein n=1 Tax=Pyrolobus fumarii (strain DSM 11204 / 1A) TaxID=694429 RepID=G0EFM0_PYRF1|nr:hypothetical protein [Pyrolobus fumarii]AEM38191.1 hypothetical protein Pyrfu_0319 [Pyrolobus fumarii 1A]
MVKREDLVLAVAWELLRARRERGLRDPVPSLYDLTKVLARLREMGVDVGLEFIEYSHGPYSPDLEPFLEELSERGLGVYRVDVHIPRAPVGVDPDYAWAIIEHQLSERDADRKYVRKRFEPRAEPGQLPGELQEKIRAAVRGYLEEASR